MLNSIMTSRLLRYKYLLGIKGEENHRGAKLYVSTLENSLIPVSFQYAVGKGDNKGRFTVTETVLGVSSAN